MAIILNDCSGGLNVYDSPTEILADQVVTAQNVLWSTAKVAVRRLGMVRNDDWNTFGGARAVHHLHRHLASGVDSTAQLFLNVTVSGGGSYGFRSADTSFHVLTPQDAATGPLFSTASAHQKCHVAYASAVSRMHIQAGIGDPSTANYTVRRSGIGEPGPLTSVTTSGAGAYTGTRYFRYRLIYQSGGTVWRRSEPSVSTTFAPPGTGEGATLTQSSFPTATGQYNAWEVEASDDDADYYRIATVDLPTTTYVDTTQPASQYAVSGVLSEQLGDYLPIWGAKFVVVDEDRIVVAGAHGDVALQSRVGWTPVYGEPGVGNDERITADPVSYEDLNTGNGGQITNMVGPVNNIIYVSKNEQLYKMVRTNNRARAYIIVPISKTIGAVEGSMVEGTDETGASCVYFLDPQLGAHRLGQFGLQYVGQDVWPLWNVANLDSSAGPVGAFYNPTEGQVIWTYATAFSSLPSACFVFNTEHGRTTETGDVRKGWAVYTGKFARALLCGVMYSHPIITSVRGPKLVPHFGTYGLTDIGDQTDANTLQLGETGDTDDGTTYRSYIVTRPYVAGQTTLQKTEAKVGQLIAPPASGVDLAFRVWADFGKEQSNVVTQSLTPTAHESAQSVSRIFRYMDNLSLADCRVTQVEFGDPDDDGNTFWQLDRADLALVKNEMMGGGG